MKLQLWRGLLCCFLLAVGGCSTDLATSLDGKPCDSSGSCLDGYVCDPQTNLCVRSAAVDPSCPEGGPCAGGGGGDGDPSAPSGGSGALPPGDGGGGPTVPGGETCAPDATECGGVCSDLAQDANNCGGCGAKCSSPVNGTGICLQGDCNFACNKPYTPCGISCVDVSSDPNNCGACGRACAGCTGSSCGRKRKRPMTSA